MAQQLKLVLRDDFTSDIADTSLISFTDGFQLAYAGWTPSYPEDRDEDDNVPESITLRAKGTSENNLASLVQEIAERKKQVDQYRENAVEPYGIWLRTQYGSEGNARQALVTDIRRRTSSPYEKIGVSDYKLSEYQLGLMRKAWWEDTASTTFTGSNLHAIGGSATYTGNVGDIHARLAQVKLLADNVVGHSRFWLGFRPSRYGTAANFQSTWSLRLGNNFGDDTTGGTDNADATARDGYKVVCDFGGETGLVQRVNIIADGVTANESDQRGEFQVLLRAKNSAAGTTRVRLRSGWYNDFPQSRSRVAISSTAWLLYDMGTVNIPNSRLKGGAQSLVYYGFAIDAEQVSGTPDLELDCLILIPRNEGFVYADMTGEASFTSSLPYYAYHRADGKKECDAQDAGGRVVASTAPDISGGLPVAPGIMVIAADAGTASAFTTIDVELKVYQRWDWLRGSET